MESIIETCKIPIIDTLHIEINIEDNPYDISMESLFAMAARINKKRSFLFVSKVLGKHVAVEPYIPILVGNLLALKYVNEVYGYKKKKYEEWIQEIVGVLQGDGDGRSLLEKLQQETISLPGKATFLGFAETATALGHSVYSMLASNAHYIHTTREQIQELQPLLTFEEEHSHATDHRVYALDASLFEGDREIIFIDDEITTGKTIINIIQSIKKQYPNLSRFTVISILDWRTKEYRDRFTQLEKGLNIRIHQVSLLQGSIKVAGELIAGNEKKREQPKHKAMRHYISLSEYIERYQQAYTSQNADGSITSSGYCLLTGRFGIDSNLHHQSEELLKSMGAVLKEMRKGKRTLVIGTGEFMYLPMKLATYMGDEVYVQSTTRSPIYPSNQENYPIKNKCAFQSIEHIGIDNYLYNINANEYDEIFVMAERIQSINSLEPLLHELEKSMVEHIHIVTFVEEK